jgi:GTP-binding protein EngB required for normal cell division
MKSRTCSANCKPIYELAAGAFIRKATDVFFVGPSDVGKTHLAQAIGYEATIMTSNHPGDSNRPRIMGPVVHILAYKTVGIALTW